ncbi:LacI family DNA-binding transcriptional regulator [Bacillus sp. B1-b2]|uniref:LacI family DNA-binding transcriptional regulator n=1 Tax=Bacillus sp. B1-b2 TaxID=2653201 RepID=UPI0012619B84|nr:LacI family DNA-binding transcriptional regulator [Bacillus sp. B1-b2]KAB7665140.1 LacI family transcriptional regulator [Bacillus sp. B1-b2]
MGVTIKDVGKLANVSPSTVSRVLANHPKISDETKRKVREAMEELGYHPNLQARSLVVKSTKTIGIIMPNSTERVLENPFFPEVLRGICLEARKSQFGIYLTTGATEEEILQEVIEMVQGKRVDGIILLYSKTNDQIMDYLLQNKFPFTVIGRPFQNAERISYVDNDNVYITKEITEYLIGLGHRSIAFIGANMEMVFTIDRLSGYKQALKENGIEFQKNFIVYDKELNGQVKEKILELLKQEVAPTAFVVSDDFIAIELLSYAEELQISVPDDLSIVAFNNIPTGKYMKPSLTSVDINIFQLGVEATKCLLEEIKFPQSLTKRITVPAKMIERSSCGVISV